QHEKGAKPAGYRRQRHYFQITGKGHLKGFRKVYIRRIADYEKAFNAALVDGQGKAISGVNITFNINGVFYHRTTNADGVTKLNIRLMPGEYIITSMYDECWASNKIIISA
uniref:hypothetical protein n=1 Tax=Methanobrevibacter smithii TaxID=2173 RepID=UPI0037DC3631